jgi:hypothetical protein
LIFIFYMPAFFMSFASSFSSAPFCGSFSSNAPAFSCGDFSSNSQMLLSSGFGSCVAPSGCAGAYSFMGLAFATPSAVIAR